MQSAATAVFDADFAACPWSAATFRDDGPPTALRAHAVDFESQRGALTRYAMHALRNAADAEDAVQETMTAAMQSAARFAGRSSIKTWLVGILKHKIIDIYRRRSRETVVADLSESQSDDIDALFTPDGCWAEPPASWGSPEAALSQRDFFVVLEGCIACLPEGTAQVFTMREIMDLEVGEICDVLGITPDNCFVRLHRARMKLRELLEQRWFAAPAAAPD